MKKLLYGLCALMMVFFVASCDSKKGGDDENEKDGDIKSIIKDMEENCDDWEASDWDQFHKDFYEAYEAFLDSDPTEEEFEEIEKMIDDAGKALSGNAKKKMRKSLDNLENNKNFQKLENRVMEKFEEYKKKQLEETLEEEEAEPVAEDYDADSLKCVEEYVYDDYDADSIKY